MSGRSSPADDVGDAPVRAALLPVALFLAFGVSVVFAHAFLATKPFKVMQPSWLLGLLATISAGSAAGSVALSWRLLRRFPYAMPIAAASATILCQVVLPPLLLRIVVGGSGEGDFGWRAATDDLRALAAWLIKPVAALALAAGVIGLGCRWIWPGK